MRQPEQRLGSGPTNALEIMNHGFFRDTNWDDICHKRVPVPYMPPVKSREDTSNFDSEFTSMVPVLTPIQSGTHKPHLNIGIVFLLTIVNSAYAGYARRVPRLLAFR